MLKFLIKNRREILVIALLGIIYCSYYFDDAILVTSSSNHDYLNYCTDFLSHTGTDGVAIGVGKFLGVIALALVAFSPNFHWVFLFLHGALILFEVFLIVMTKIDGYVSYFHTIVYNNGNIVFVFFVCLFLYVSIIISFFIDLIKKPKIK